MGTSIFHPAGRSLSCFQPGEVRTPSDQTKASHIHPSGRALSVNPSLLHDENVTAGNQFRPNVFHPSGRLPSLNSWPQFDAVEATPVDISSPLRSPELQPSGTKRKAAQNKQQPQNQVPKFPTTSTRQRTSNVNLVDAEAEFNKTALNACRSTITQQEVELKRFGESLDIRNKRIMNLESQVGHASELFAARNDSSPDDLNKNFHLKIDKLFDKLSQFPNSPATNIVINSCHKENTVRHSNAVATQTDFLQSPCKQCNISTETQSNRKDHDEAHQSSQPLADFTCDICGLNFSTCDKLENHFKTAHEVHVAPL